MAVPEAVIPVETIEVELTTLEVLLLEIEELVGVETMQSVSGRQVNLLIDKSNGPTQQTNPVSQTLDPLTQSLYALIVGVPAAAEVVVVVLGAMVVVEIGFEASVVVFGTTVVLDELEITAQSAEGLHVDFLIDKSKGPTQHTNPVSQTLDPITQSLYALIVGPLGAAEVEVGFETVVVVVRAVVVVGTIEQSSAGRQVNLPKVKSKGPTQQTNPASHLLAPTVQSL